jgi:succinate dehydrogenase hydrophobic anchor subunit
MKKLVEFTAPNGMRVVITDKSDPRNVKLFSKVIENLSKGN